MGSKYDSTKDEQQNDQNNDYQATCHLSVGLLLFPSLFQLFNGILNEAVRIKYM